MADGTCNPKVCIWSESDSFCKVLAKANVPLDKKWPFLILYLRGISDVPFLSEVQKNEMQELLVGVLKNKNLVHPAEEYF